MTDEKKSFTVKDRRHFTADGEAREHDLESSSPEEKPRNQAEKTAEARSAPPPRPQPAAGESFPSGPEPARRPGLDFAGLLLSLATQASLLLGMGDEEEPGAAPDFQGAQAIISLLEVLRDKTEGRRTPDEERILEGVLYELRMAYVAGTRAGGA
jgi:Domain of unknown function (DUF1844)